MGKIIEALAAVPAGPIDGPGGDDAASGGGGGGGGGKERDASAVAAADTSRHKFSKVLNIVTLCSQCTWTLTMC